MRRIGILIVLVVCLAVQASAQQLTPRQLDILSRLADAIDAMQVVEPPPPPPPPDPDPEPTRDPILVATSAELQLAFDAAIGGDTVILEPGVEFAGNFTFGPKDSLVTVIVTGATIKGAGPWSALSTTAGASNWRFVGGTWRNTYPSYPVIKLGTSTQTLEEVPHHIEFDGVEVLGDPELGGKRGIEANASDVVIQNCRVMDFKWAGQDSQAISWWNTPGRIRVQNCILTASGENLMVGGSDMTLGEGVNPTGLEIWDNTFYKPFEWRNLSWTEKNLLELKTGKDVSILRNKFYNSWVDGQIGYALLLKSVNQDGKNPWAEVSDVEIAHNEIWDVSLGISLLKGQGKVMPDGTIAPYVPMSRINIHDNIIRTNKALMGGNGRCINIQQVADVTFDHNLCDVDATVIYIDGDSPRMKVRGNVINDRCAGDCWGIMGSGTGEGLNVFFVRSPDALVEGNLISTPTAYLYYSETKWPTWLNTIVAELPSPIPSEFGPRAQQ